MGKSNHIKTTASVAIGATVAALGLEAFLIPNHLIDGGVVGISIISAHIFNMPVGLFLFFINLPFLLLGNKKLGSRFAVLSLSGIVALAGLTQLLHDSMIATADPLLAAVFGGAIVGCGVGIVIRYGGTLDGAEIIAILVDRKSSFSVGEIVMFFNLFIIGGAGLVYGWDKAMYSLIAYFVAYKVIDITVEGLDESRAVWIISNEYVKIGRAINEQLGRKVTFVNASAVSGKVSNGVILSVITRIEEQRLKAVIADCDKNAFVVIGSVHDVMGKSFSAKH
jgi:uncharacterized membrane-anchored protein YitT (DUF2179 family)